MTAHPIKTSRSTINAGLVLFAVVYLATLAIVIAPERLHKAPTAPAPTEDPSTGRFQSAQ